MLWVLLLLFLRNSFTVLGPLRSEVLRSLFQLSSWGSLYFVSCGPLWPLVVAQWLGMAGWPGVCVKVALAFRVKANTAALDVWCVGCVCDVSNISKVHFLLSTLYPFTEPYVGTLFFFLLPFSSLGIWAVERFALHARGRTSHFWHCAQSSGKLQEVSRMGYEKTLQDSKK